MGRFIQIDENGYFRDDAKTGALRIADQEMGRRWLASMSLDNRARPIIEINGEQVIVEAFDEPFVALEIESVAGTVWRLTMPYGHKESFNVSTLSLDEWDRFHGRTERGIPFVLSRPAHASFFDQLEAYDDDSITVDGQRFAVRPWLSENISVNEAEFWSNIYRTETPRWDLGEPTPALMHALPRLKLQPARILVPGAGGGHDAAWLASQGHIVTAVDFSAEAIARARKNYGHVPHLTFLHLDVFQLPPDMNGSFDMIFEYTCYCAVTPSRRNELVRVWRRLLTDNGHLLGIFFTMDRPNGPPYGGSEWELRQRLGKSFRLLYWTRLRDSVPARLGQELLIYAQKIPALT